MDKDKKVDKETVEQYIVDSEAGSVYEVSPYPIEGIPEGFSFLFKKEQQVNNLFHFGHLVGFTPGMKWDTLGAAYYKPVLYSNDASQDVIDMEFKQQADALLALYKDNVKKING